MTPITVRLEEGYQTTMQIRDHVIVADEPVDAGGQNAGPTPLELFVGTLGACIAVTTKAYAQRKHWPLEGVSVEVSMERVKAADVPAYQGDAPLLHTFREQVVFDGPLTDEQRARLHEIARKCPVRVALETPAIFIEEQVEVP
jgi:putative redox protein